jgi:hypothetical protein
VKTEKAFHAGGNRHPLFMEGFMTFDKNCRQEQLKLIFLIAQWIISNYHALSKTFTYQLIVFYSVADNCAKTLTLRKYAQ